MTNNNDLNNIFVEENSPAANDTDTIGAMKINIVNTANSTSDTFTVYPENTMSDVLTICENIGIHEKDVPQCVFECNGKTTSDLEMTCAELGVVDGGKLMINPYGKVA